MKQLSKKECSKIKNIASEMYVTGSKHLERLKQFGKNISEETRESRRCFINYIIEDFGEEDINKLPVSTIQEKLFNDYRNKSGSWKNSYLETFSQIYSETIWHLKKPVPKPQFQRFSRNSVQSGIFTTEELFQLFNQKLWNNQRDYLLYNCIIQCGLRLGEARGLKPSQFDFNNKVLIVDGFCKRNGFRTNYNKKGSAINKKLHFTKSDKRHGLSVF